MKLICLISLALLVTPGAFAQTSKPSKTSDWATHLAPDFVIGTPPALKMAPKLLSVPVAEGDCKKRIAQITCSVKDPQDPNCGKVNHKAIENLEYLYDILQKPLKKMFCSLPRIFIVDKMESLAMAGMGHKGAAFMFVSRELVEKDIDPDAVFGWKEQKIFGSQLPRYEVGKEGPQVWIKSKSPLQTLQYVVTHEFAHILDFMNGANRFACAPGKSCPPANTPEEYEANMKNMIPEVDSWGAFSWKNPLEPNQQNMFPLWKKLCFYGCDDRDIMKPADMFDFYFQFDRTNFVTTYAATNPWDDFAESTTFYFMANADYDLQYRVSTGKAIFFWEWRWDQFTKKNNWIELFYEGDLKYPQLW